MGFLFAFLDPPELLSAARLRELTGLNSIRYMESDGAGGKTPTLLGDAPSRVDHVKFAEYPASFHNHALAMFA